MSVHDGERFLREAVDSILAQTLTELELIVVDDKLEIGFPGPPTSGPGDSGGEEGDSGGTPAKATLEIVIKGSSPPEGWKRVVEGYDRALRAQIPG